MIKSTWTLFIFLSIGQEKQPLDFLQFIYSIALGKFGFSSTNMTGNCSNLLTALSILVYLLKSINDFLIFVAKYKP